MAGNFHFSVDRSDQAALLSVFKGREGINMSHAVTELAFGESYPGLVNPLDGVSKMITSGARSGLRQPDSPPSRAESICARGCPRPREPPTSLYPPGTLSRPPMLLR